MCKEGQVARADGTCSDIGPDIIAEVRELVRLKKEALDVEQKKFDGIKAPCKDGHPPYQIVLLAHEEYRKALDLLLALLALMKEKPPTPAEKAAEAEAELGPEFVKGEITGKAECETWMSNSTVHAKRGDCAIICRNEPSCAGFAIDKKYHWCVWFKRLPPKPTPDCATTVSQFVKRRNVTTDDDMWAAVAKIHAMEEQLQTLMISADTDAQTANEEYHEWIDSKNKSAKDMLKWNFTQAKNYYTWTIQDAETAREEREKAIHQAWDMVQERKASKPPFTTTTTTTEAMPSVEVIETTTVSTTTTTPRPLMWNDFPNSQDTQWSLQHPECPMGPPCFCNCKCRGSPPQNFIEPPPDPPAPCPPPPPTPDPSRLSLPLGAPPATPLR